MTRDEALSELFHRTEAAHLSLESTRANLIMIGLVYLAYYFDERVASIDLNKNTTNYVVRLYKSIQHHFTNKT